MIILDNNCFISAKMLADNKIEDELIEAEDYLHFLGAITLSYKPKPLDLGLTNNELDWYIWYAASLVTRHKQVNYEVWETGQSIYIATKGAKQVDLSLLDEEIIAKRLGYIKNYQDSIWKSECPHGSCDKPFWFVPIEDLELYEEDLAELLLTEYKQKLTNHERLLKVEARAAKLKKENKCKNTYFCQRYVF